MKKENNYTKGIGMVISVATDNMWLWMSLGILFGASYGKTQQAKMNNNK